MLLQAFIIECKIGAGCFGNVYRVRSKDDGQLFAVIILTLLFIALISRYFEKVVTCHSNLSLITW